MHPDDAQSAAAYPQLVFQVRTFRLILGFIVVIELARQKVLRAAFMAGSLLPAEPVLPPCLAPDLLINPSSAEPAAFPSPAQKHSRKRRCLVCDRAPASKVRWLALPVVESE